MCLQAAVQIEKLYELFISRDATQVEVNPLGETDDGRGIKLQIFTHNEIFP